MMPNQSLHRTVLRAPLMPRALAGMERFGRSHGRMGDPAGKV